MQVWEATTNYYLLFINWEMSLTPYTRSILCFSLDWIIYSAEDKLFYATSTTELFYAEWNEAILNAVVDH